MVYVTETRASTDALSHLCNGSQSNLAFLPAPGPVHVGQLTRFFSSSTQVTQRYAAPYGAFGSLGGVVGNQTTKSWRTGKALSRSVGDRVLRGDEIIQAIRAGYDIEIEGSVTTSNLIDRNVSAYALGRKLNAYDTGHNFETVKNENQSNIKTRLGTNWQTLTLWKRESPNELRRLDWWGYPPGFSMGANPLSINNNPPSLAVRLANGSKLVALAAPSRPYVDVVRSVGELIKDGLPSLIGASLLKNLGSRGSASEYLNFQFGIMPILGDAKNILKAVIESRDILASYNSASGEFTRRKRSFPDVDSVEVKEATGAKIASWTSRATPTGAVSSMSSYLDVSNMKMTYIGKKKSNTYFSGAFTYAVPDGESLMNRFDYYADQAGKLFGRGVTLSTLYDLTPFSWLLDWVVDFGNVFSNAYLFNSNNLVMKYGYVMHKSVLEQSATITGIRDERGNPLPSFIQSELVNTYSFRDRATPYGFAIDVDTLTTYQWSILAALGLSRGRNIRLNESL